MSSVLPKPTRPLVIINGLGAPRAASQVYGLFFRAHGYRVYVVPQRFLNIGDIRESAARTDAVVRRALAATGAARTPLVGISLGGLIGHYYVHVHGGAPLVDTFVSVGGPLNGTPAARLGAALFRALVPSLRQARPDSDLIAELRAAPRPEGVRLVSLGTRGDVMTPAASRYAPGYEIVDTPHGVTPLGHWFLYLHPANVQAVYDLIR